MERLAKTAIDPLVEHQPISQTMVLDVAYKADTAKKKEEVKNGTFKRTTEMTC